MNILKKLIYLLMGGKLKYRVNGAFVEMKGGGTGHFWFPAHSTAFESEKRARILAKMWADREGGEFIE